MPVERLTHNVPNAASGTIVGTVSAASTTATVTFGDSMGVDLPLKLAVWNRAYGDAPTAKLANAYELVRVSARSGDSILTMLRGQDGTTAIDWDSTAGVWQWDGVISREDWLEVDALIDQSLDQVSKWIDVTESPYNAVGDAVADDTASFVDALGDAAEGDTVYVPPGIYQLTSSITFSARVNFLCEGTLYINHAAEGVIVSGITNTASPTPQYVFNLYRSPSHTITETVGVRVVNSTGLHIVLRSVFGFYAGISIESESGQNSLGNSVFLGNIYGCRHGVRLASDGTGMVRGNRFIGGSYRLPSGSPAGYVANRVSYRFATVAATNCQGNIFDSPDIYDLGDAGTFFAEILETASSETKLIGVSTSGATVVRLLAGSNRNHIEILSGGVFANITNSGQDNRIIVRGTNDWDEVGTNPKRIRSRVTGVAALELENTGTGHGLDNLAKTRLREDATLDANLFVAGDAKIGGGIPWVDVTHADFGAVGDGTTDDTAAFQAGIDLLEAAGGGTLFIPRPASFYKLTATLTIEGSNIVIMGLGDPEIRQVTAGQGGIQVNGQRDNITFRGFTIRGPQFATYTLAERAILATGTNSTAPSTRIHVENMHLVNWGGSGVELRHVERARVTNSLIEDIVYFACSFQSVIGGFVSGNHIRNVTGDPATGNCYGISMSRNESGTIANDARCQQIQVIGNTVEDIPTWEGIETHAGVDITISGNTVLGCRRGISAGAGDNASGDPTYAPRGVTISGNTVEWDGAVGTAFEGIILHGAYDSSSGLVNEYATGSISGNTIIGHSQSTEATENSGAIRCYATHGLVLAANAIIDPAQAGIHITIYNVGFVCVGNSIIDPWRTSTSTVRIVGVYVQAGQNQGIITGNRTQYIGTSGVAGAEHLNDVTSTYGIFVVNAAGNQVHIGVNAAPDAGTAKVFLGVGTVGSETAWSVDGNLSVAAEKFLQLPQHSSLPSAAANEGSIIYYTVDNTFRGSDGTSWVVL